MIDWYEGDRVFICDGKGCGRWVRPDKEQLLACYNAIFREGWWVSPGTSRAPLLHLCPTCARTKDQEDNNADRNR